MNSELSYWLAFAKLTSIGPVRFRQIINHFDTLEAAWQAEVQDFLAAGLPEHIAQGIPLRRSEINPDDLIAELVQHKIQVVTLNDEQYPKLLKEIADAPPLLYFKGTLTPDKLALSVVGSRKMSAYGKQVIETLVPAGVRLGASIVSGMAFGVDAHAHEVCIDRGGRTIAVLASGLDTNSIYPSHNRYIAEKIIANGGLLLSENPIGTIPMKQHFPQRNRIIAGLSQATLVVEAAQKSGANITAYQALEYNRSVGAVPGSIYSPTSAGCHTLMQKGADVVTCADDVARLLGIDPETKHEHPETREDLDEQQNALYEYIEHTPIHFDDLVAATGLATDQIATLITELELKEYIKDVGGGRYVRRV